jgi:hypothetical protein
MNPLCKPELVCDTTVEPAPVTETVVVKTCGLTPNKVFTNATIRTDANGCIFTIENGELPAYTPDPCCPTGGGGTGGGASGLDGNTGDAGPAGTIAIGSVSTVAAGTPASVVNIGTANAAILNIAIPAGPPGTPAVNTTGLNLNAAGYVITNGVIQALPGAWPPMLNFTSGVSSNSGVVLTMNEDSTGAVTISVDASAMRTEYLNQVNALTSTVNAQQVDINGLQADLDAAQTAFLTLKARVDSAGIP